MRAQGNLYNSRLGKVTWFVRRFGAAELIKKPVRMLLAPIIVPRLPRKTFIFQGQQLDYFYHAYNMTWATERCVEIPISRFYASQVNSPDLLEVGNVLAHYGPVRHAIVDKFESGPGVINQDILQFTPPKPYRLILSISTFEHIGFDDDTGGRSGGKIVAALEHCRKLLLPAGRLVVTVPIGYNPDLDELIASDRLGCSQEHFLKRFAARDWASASKSQALACQYARPFPYANAIAVLEWQAAESAT